MPPEESIQVADEVLLAHAGNPLTDIQRLILCESLAGKGYESMEGYAPQHIKNEGKKLWDLLSEALGEKVSKTSFKGALEKRWKLGKLIPKPPLLSIYNPQTWVGRKAIIDECLLKLQGQARILWITGISGIGKTALGECLASQAWEGDPSFQWLYLEILEGQSREFVSVAADLLAKLGEVDLDPQERNDPERLMEKLLRKLKVSRYWLQVDSLERLLNSEQPIETEFADHHWVIFLQRCLTEPNFASRLVLTAQALPSSLVELEDRYPNLWQVITLQGLLAHQQDEQQPNEHLELFAKNGLSVDDISSIHLRRIGQIYEGHPLVLQVIAKEILASPFDGNVVAYWRRYGDEFEQVARELQTEQIRPELYNQALQKRVRRRVEVSLKRLPTDAFDLLCRSSVYRRPVPETFWLSLFEEQTSQRQQQAYQILNERAFIEREGIHQNQFLIRQHNLVRAVAYDLLKVDTQMWHQSERQAAQLWLTDYKPAPDVSNLEIYRGYLEAFNHFCVVEDWDTASELFMQPLNPPRNSKLYWLLFCGSHYQEQLQLCEKMAVKATPEVEIVCQNGIGIAYDCLADYRRAIAAYKKSLSLAREIGDRHKEGNTLVNMGIAHSNLGEYQQAIELYQQQLEIARAIGDRRGEGLALGNLGGAYSNLGEYQQAIEFILQDLAIAREIGDRRGEGNALGNLGVVYTDLGEYQQAIEFTQQSLEVTREAGDQRGESMVLGNLAGIYSDLGEYQQAVNIFHQRLQIAREIKDQRGEGNALGGLGNACISLGQYEQAIKFLQQALVVSQEIENRQGEANALSSLGIAYRNLGEYQQAIEFTQALVIKREIGDRRGESNALGSLGIAYSNLEEYEQAIDCHQQSLTIAREIGDLRGQGIALLNMGATQLKLKRYQECLTNNRAGMEIFQGIGDRDSEAKVFKNLAELHQALGEVEVARQYCQQALALATELGIPLAEECQKLKQELEERGASERK
jgi:tetratricopeptide (TPR) repeat protein